MKKLFAIVIFLFSILSVHAQTNFDRAKELALADMKKSNPVVKEYRFEKLDTLYSDYKTDPIYLSFENKRKINQINFEHYKKITPHYNDNTPLSHATVVKMTANIKHYTDIDIALLNTEKKYIDGFKGKFIGWKMVGVFSDGQRNYADTYKFDKEVTKIIGYNSAKIE